MPINSKIFEAESDGFDFESRITSGEVLGSDNENENTLRPKTFDEYIGQEKVKENLRVFMDAAKIRGDCLDHVLLHGPPGLGKTTLSCIIGNELGVNLRITSGPAIEKAGDLAALLTTLEQGDILFIDEIHRLSRQVEEVLYSAMEDYALDLMMGKGPSARSIRIPLQRFTLIGATTRSGQLSSPLRDRFGIIFRLELYSPEELAVIVGASAAKLNMPLSDDGAWAIAKRSRGTPRIANRYLRRVRDFATVKGAQVIDAETAYDALDRLEVDDLGLDMVDRKMLDAIITSFGGGPVGLDTLAAMIGEEPITIEDVYEPYLLQLGFIHKTPRGRCAAKGAYEHMGIPFPAKNGGQITLGEEV